MGLWERMRQREAKRGAASVAVVGAGWVAQGLVHRLARTPGLRPALIVNRSPQRGVAAYRQAGFSPEQVVVADDARSAEAAMQAGRPVVTTSSRLLGELSSVEVVVEATGAIDHGAAVMLECLKAGHPVVSINAEVDATIGYLLHDAAEKAGTVYTICDGDQPGVLLRQIQFIEGIGFELVAAVNCKRHLDVHQTPDSSAPYAARDGTSPEVTTSAGDGTKMHIECAVVANVMGMPPDCRGMHGVRTTLDRALGDVLGALSRRRAVEYSLGGDFGAGVFVIGHAPEPDAVQRQLRFMKMGDGPDYLFFRPYHLVHLEMPLTLAEVVLDGEGLGRPTGRPVAEVVALAKRDLRAGEQLDGIGGYCCYGQIDTVAGAEGLLPVTLAGHARVLRPLQADYAIPLGAVELDEEAEIVRLRRRQDELLTKLVSQ